MLNRLRKLFASDEEKVVQKVSMKPFVLHPKECLAWIQALEGNIDFLGWAKLEREDIYHATKAIFLENDSRDWLVKNGYPQIMAMIHAAEGDVKAQAWLKQFKMDELYHMAMAVEDEAESWNWLKMHSTEAVFLLTKAIKKRKDDIEHNHNDIHTFNKSV